MKGLYKAAAIICAMLPGSLPALAAGVEVPLAGDLRTDGELAENRALPILLAFTAIDCSYCELLEEEFLQPMLLGGEYTDRVIMRKVVLDTGARLADFSGRQRDATSLADAYHVFVTPTLLFVDGRGKEMAGRMVGINTPELFGGYLDDCIETALIRIRESASAPLPVTCLENTGR